MNDESPLRTLGVAAGVAFVCSIAVATAVSLLQPYQRAYAAIDRNRAILRAARLIEQDQSDRTVVAEYVKLEPRLIDLAVDRVVSDVDAASYDYEAALGAGAPLLPLPEGADIARIGGTPRLMPLYVSPETGRTIVPFFGRGMWSTISGYLSLEADLDTVAGIAILSHAETPGVGDRIEDRRWQSGWQGRIAYDRDRQVALRIGDADAAPEHRIDAITGATVTAEGLERAIRFWLGPDGFGPTLERMREGEQ